MFSFESVNFKPGVFELKYNNPQSLAWQTLATLDVTVDSQHELNARAESVALPDDIPMEVIAFFCSARINLYVVGQKTETEIGQIRFVSEADVKHLEEHRNADWTAKKKKVEELTAADAAASESLQQAKRSCSDIAARGRELPEGSDKRHELEKEYLAIDSTLPDLKKQAEDARSKLEEAKSKLGESTRANDAVIDAGKAWRQLRENAIQKIRAKGPA